MSDLFKRNGKNICAGNHEDVAEKISFIRIYHQFSDDKLKKIANSPKSYGALIDKKTDIEYLKIKKSWINNKLYFPHK